PGMKDATRMPACYTYFSDESATMMTITESGLQIHRGTASVVRAKTERLSRELGENVPVMELTPEVIEKLIPVPWYSLSLFEDRARRVLAALSVFAALGVVLISVLIWFFAAMAMISTHAEIAQIKERSQNKSMQLMQNVQNLRASPMREQVAKFADLNDGLLTLNGFLEVYQISGGKLLWRAIIPANVTSNRISEIGGQTLDTGPQGVVIGNSREALSVKRSR
ncbi:MAG: hypothetical protein PHX43_08550, partial [Alphaproteobacteria bacterium]|nr:hypothetical protein [Alphaproteobacteria bacterium]